MGKVTFIVTVVGILITSIVGSNVGTTDWHKCLIFSCNVLLIILAILFLMFFIENPEQGDKSSDHDRNRDLIRNLAKKSPLFWYRRTLERVLDGLDRYLTPEQLRSEDTRTHPIRAFNWKSLDRAMLLAVAYPILLPMAMFALTGSAMTLGGIEIIPTAASSLQQLVLAIFIIYALSIKQIGRFLSMQLIKYAYSPM